jgi:membrane protease YdiL (CAAX protease family)
LKKHPFATFVVLAFALSWYPWLLHLTRLVPRASGMNPLGVLAAAFITAALLHGRAGAKELLIRLVRFRVHSGWYAFALGLPVIVAVTALGISVLIGARLDAPFRPDPLALLKSFVFMFFFVGVGEETGWRGFAVPELLTHHSWRRVAFEVGVVWALWHAPLFGTQITWLQLPAFLTSVFAASVLTTFLFLRTRFSLPLVCAFHGMVDAFSGCCVFPLFSGRSLTLLWWVDSLLWCAAAGFLLLRYNHAPYAAAVAPVPAVTKY